MANPTPYSAALVCLGDYARGRNMLQPRIAVGRVLDYTGKEDIEGRKVTQGASLMDAALLDFLVSALRIATPLMFAARSGQSRASIGAAERGW